MSASSDVALLCSELICIDSSVRGGHERPLAERVATELSDLGLEPTLLESEHLRSSVVARITGSDPSAPGLLVHIHLDVVPADAAEWTVPPFSGEIRDGHVWGRGAVDMKDMAAMTLVAMRTLLGSGWQPRRDIVLAFVADEELGGRLGAGWLVDHHPELFEGCTEAIGEAGGFSHEYAPGQRAYLVQSAEKGIGWLRLVARGAGGHGSMHHDDNAVAVLSRAVDRLATHDFAPKPSAASAALGSAARAWTGAATDDEALSALGSLSRLLVPTLRNTYQPTVLQAGMQHNIVPPRAEVLVDGRFVPGHEDAFFEEVRDLLAGLVDVETVFRNGAVETPFTGEVPARIVEALSAEDPGSRTIPVCLPIGTDAKHFARLGIRCFGFVPLQLPAQFDFPAMWHGPDERVPVSALDFGQRVLERFFSSC